MNEQTAVDELDKDGIWVILPGLIFLLLGIGCLAFFLVESISIIYSLFLKLIVLLFYLVIIIIVVGKMEERAKKNKRSM